MMSRNFIPEQTLIDKFLLDDALAFEELCRRYSYSLYTYCLAKLNSQADAKRTVRTVFIALWEKRNVLPLDFSLSVYLYTEVRKAVVQCLNSKLNNNTDIPAIEEGIIPSFSAHQLQQAKLPVKYIVCKRSNNHSTLISKGKYDEPWREKTPMISLKALKQAVQNMLHLS
jgi:hypothetical protein